MPNKLLDYAAREVIFDDVAVKAKSEWPVVNTLVDLGLLLTTDGIASMVVRPAVAETVTGHIVSLPLPITHVDFADEKDAQEALREVCRTVNKSFVDELLSVSAKPMQEAEALWFYGPFVELVSGVIVQATPDSCRAIIGLPLGVWKWGGKYKAACIMVLQLRKNGEGNFGVFKA